MRASIPLIGPWVLQPREHKPAYAYSLKALRACPTAFPNRWNAFCAQVEQVAVSMSESCSLPKLNASVLAVCSRFFPPETPKTRQTSLEPTITGSVRAMWDAYKQWRQVQGRRTLRGNLFKAWRRFALFKEASRRLRKTSVLARRQRIYAIIDRAASAATRDQMNELYNITRILAPRQRRERVRVRSEAGAMLSPHAQFREIERYFSTAFSDPDRVPFCSSAEAPIIDDLTLQTAIQSLKPRKSVPLGSIWPEVWKACASPFATCLAGAYRASVSANPSTLPAEITDCSSALIPKPGKSTLPKDLRPIGIQDPASKLIAQALRAQLSPQTADLLQRVPQYAYCEGKGIDQAIQRVIAHCHSTRQRLQEGSISVHARRAGKRCSTCYGGIMIGIDMSRAFDNLTRKVLLQSLQFAGVSASLQRILLEIHDSRQYELRHHRYSAKFRMEKGVRQGCSVSPMLYSLFTAWLLSELSTRTSDTWIQQLVTCFADDTHLAWTIEQPSDLDFVCRSLRATFQLLRECNMVVNSDKSSVVIGLKGSQAKRWIRQHTVAKAGRKCIDFGVPGDPLCIPMVDSFVYLGIVVTYKQFELLSLQHRVKTASANRARLNKLLHSKQHALRRRVSLYLSCVRSTLLFGLHVVGLTDATLKKLEAVEARHLRSIARSPVHLTRESNHALRTRLCVRSPARDMHSLFEAPGQTMLR